jgi:hypothetical protein
MNFKEFSDLLSHAPDATVRIALPAGEILPEHFHVTEVGKVIKDFVDCGGTRRSEETCVLQTFVANDTHHRVTASKLSQILKKCAVLEIAEHTEVEVEVQGSTIELYRVGDANMVDGALVLELAAKKTACLATDKCGIGVLQIADAPCCGNQSNCC